MWPLLALAVAVYLIGKQKKAPVSAPAPSPAPAPVVPTATDSLGLGLRFYTVMPGDSLSSIAARYGTTWQAIYAANKDLIGDDPNLIYPGQRLLIA